MSANSVTVTVNDRHKTLRFAELLTTGSTYALAISGATVAAGAIFVTCRVDGTETLVAYGTVASNAATLSTNTAELKAAMANLPVGAVRTFFCVIHKDGTTDYENVATGTMSIANAGGTWTNTTTGAALLYKGDKGDKGDKPVITTTKTGGTTTIYADGTAIGTVLDGEAGATKPTTGTLGADSSLDDVIEKVNTLITQLKS